MINNEEELAGVLRMIAELNDLLGSAICPTCDGSGKINHRDGEELSRVPCPWCTQAGEFMSASTSFAKEVREETRFGKVYVDEEGLQPASDLTIVAAHRFCKDVVAALNAAGLRNPKGEQNALMALVSAEDELPLVGMINYDRDTGAWDADIELRQSEPVHPGLH